MDQAGPAVRNNSEFKLLTHVVASLQREMKSGRAMGNPPPPMSPVPWSLRAACGTPPPAPTADASGRDGCVGPQAPARGAWHVGRCAVSSAPALLPHSGCCGAGGEKEHRALGASARLTKMGRRAGRAQTAVMNGQFFLISWYFVWDS